MHGPPHHPRADLSMDTIILLDIPDHRENIVGIPGKTIRLPYEFWKGAADSPLNAKRGSQVYLVGSDDDLRRPAADRFQVILLDVSRRPQLEEERAVESVWPLGVDGPTSTKWHLEDAIGSGRVLYYIVMDLRFQRSVLDS